MPANKKTHKKSPAKKRASQNKKPPVKTIPEPPVAPAEYVAPKGVHGRLLWGLLAAAAAILVAAFIVASINRRTDEPAPSQSSQSASDSPSVLHVVPGEDGGTSSTQASGALQPQPTGLQQTQPTQPTSSINLQDQQKIAN